MIRRIEDVTAQNMFDDAAEHMLAQRKRSILPGCRTACAYRGPDGLRCPIGARIPDKEYYPEFERLSVAWSTEREGAKVLQAVIRHNRLRVAARVPEELIPLARDIQRIHDSFDVDEWPAKLRLLARRRRLKVTCMNTPEMKKKARLCAKTNP